MNFTFTPLEWMILIWVSLEFGFGLEGQLKLKERRAFHRSMTTRDWTRASDLSIHVCFSSSLALLIIPAFFCFILLWLFLCIVRNSQFCVFPYSMSKKRFYYSGNIIRRQNIFGLSVKKKKR